MVVVVQLYCWRKSLRHLHIATFAISGTPQEGIAVGTFV